MNPIRVILVDDEPLALDVLETFVSRLNHLVLVKRCNNALEALEVLKEEQVDLMFLDIQMPQLTGLELVKSLAHPPCIVFTTAYPNYAIEGFEVNALDYLLKPIAFDRFVKAVNKAQDILATRQPAEEEEQESGDFIFVKSDKKLVKVNYTDILYIEGLKDYVIIKTPLGRIVTLQTMKSLEEKLPADRFIRIHRSYIVQVAKIEALDGTIVDIDKKQLPVGKNYRDELLDLVNKNKL